MYLLWFPINQLYSEHKISNEQISFALPNALNFYRLAFARSLNFDSKNSYTIQKIFSILCTLLGLYLASSGAQETIGPLFESHDGHASDTIYGKCEFLCWNRFIGKTRTPYPPSDGKNPPLPLGLAVEYDIRICRAPCIDVEFGLKSCFGFSPRVAPLSIMSRPSHFLSAKCSTMSISIVCHSSPTRRNELILQSLDWYKCLFYGDVWRSWWIVVDLFDNYFSKADFSFVVFC